MPAKSPLQGPAASPEEQETGHPLHGIVGTTRETHRALSEVPDTGILSYFSHGCCFYCHPRVGKKENIPEDSTACRRCGATLSSCLSRDQGGVGVYGAAGWPRGFFQTLFAELSTLLCPPQPPPGGRFCSWARAELPSSPSGSTRWQAGQLIDISVLGNHYQAPENDFLL